MAIRHQSGSADALGAADWLCLAAAPTFAVMALLTGVLGGGSPDMLCAAAPGASPLSGMVLMYLLMSAFHLAPWLRLISSRRSGAGNGLNAEQSAAPTRGKATPTIRAAVGPPAGSVLKALEDQRDAPAAGLIDSFSPAQSSWL
jgi:hypothetical protein